MSAPSSPAPRGAPAQARAPAGSPATGAAGSPAPRSGAEDRPGVGVFNLPLGLHLSTRGTEGEVSLLDRWCRRAALGAVLSLAAALLALGFLLYRPSTAFAGPADVNPVLNAVADAPSARSTR